MLKVLILELDFTSCLSEATMTLYNCFQVESLFMSNLGHLTYRWNMILRTSIGELNIIN